MTIRSTKLWWMLPAIATQNRVDSLAGKAKPKIELLNAAEIQNVLFGPPEAPRQPLHPEIHRPIAAEDWSHLPRPRLRVAEAGFRPDLFRLSLDFVSTRLSQAFASAGASPDYLPVECTACPAEVQDQGYRALNVTVFANPLDRSRTTPAYFIDVESGAGPTFVWVPGMPHPNQPAPVICWRDDFDPPAPMFRVPGTNWTLVTEELAAAVTAAGFEDVGFFDLTDSSKPRS
ncbi:hypothetical protein ACBY01_14575 [Sphingomonas sp. ac-8]|uniref:hypothetical protein n=1 Tax=Sphingomonas sp. ac-8 TaxID=3242977 RepID=UPI003A812D08